MFMKKSLNYLLIISIICLALTTVLCFSSIIFNEFNLFPFTSEVAENFNNAGSDNPGAGWYLLFAGGIALLGDFAIGLVLVFSLIFVPFIMNAFVLIIQCVARLFQIGVEKNWKGTVGKVLTVISIITQILLSIVLLINLISNIPVSKILLLLAFAINVTSVVLFIREFIKMNKYKKEVIETTTNTVLQ